MREEKGMSLIQLFLELYVIFVIIPELLEIPTIFDAVLHFFSTI